MGGGIGNPKIKDLKDPVLKQLEHQTRRPNLERKSSQGGSRRQHEGKNQRDGAVKQEGCAWSKGSHLGLTR